MVPVEAVNLGLMSEGQLVVLASLASMLAAGFIFIIRQIVALSKTLDQKLTVSDYQKNHRELEVRMLTEIRSLDLRNIETFKEHGSRLRSIELWAAKKNNPEFT